MNTILSRFELFTKKFEISHGQHSPLLPMEGLRGIAVFFVFLVHYCSQIEPFIQLDAFTSNLLFYIHFVGNLGVDLFFVLSGFLIYGTLISKQKTLFFPYIKRRIKRIYPTFLVVLLIYLLLSLVFPNESKFPDDILAGTIYLLQNVLLMPGIFNIDPIITVSWSLSYEIFYYVLIPLVIGFLKLRDWTVNSRIFLWLLITALGFIYFSYFSGHARLLMFISGILLYELHSHKNIKLPKYLGTICLVLAIAFNSYSLSIGLNGIWALLAVFVLFLLVCLEAFSDSKGSAKWLSIGVLRWFGNMSYSYYLIHGLTLKAFFMFFGLAIMPANQFNGLFWYAMPIIFAITLIPSILLFLFIEKPISIEK